MSAPFAFAGSLQLPGDQGLPADAIPVNMSGSFDSENKQVLNLTGSGAVSLPLGTVSGAGLKGLLIKVDPSVAGLPVIVKVNGSTVGAEISPGGFLALGSPNPVAGITAVSISYTSANIVRIWALG